MPQIEFQPPLATTTTVHLPPLSVLASAEDSHVTLSFIARPIDGLSEGDTIEIWTDGGTPGSWRAVPFERYGEDGILVAQIPVGIAEGSFGFTYRVTHASGDATWLGDMGGNGKIDLVKAEGEDALWKGEDWLKLDKDHWTGFGVHLDGNKLPSGVEISGESDLTFAYLHPSTTSSPPFATFHPTTSSSIPSTAFGLLATTGSILASTSTSTLSPSAQPSESTPTTGPPAAYASYCGLGFSGGEQERTKAFRSLLGLANHGLQYFPCTGKGDVHAVGILASDLEGGKPDRLITYLAGNGSQSTAEWDLSTITGEKSPGIALWDAGSKHAQTITARKPTFRLAADSSNSVVRTLQIVHLFEFSNDGIQTLVGILDDSKSQTQWTYSPERTETEQIFVDEVVSSPAPEKGGKALGETSDSGETVESSGVTSTLDFTSDAENETLGTSVDDVDEATLGKGKVGDADVEEGRAPVTAASQVEQETETSEATEEPAPPTNEPTVTPKKSILRFFWITLSLLNSLWWGTLSWFRQWIGRKSTETIAPGQDQPADDEDEQTPLIREVDPAQNYASTSQGTLQPEITEPVEPIEPEVSKDSAEPPAEPEIQVIRVPETRKTVFPAHISAGPVSHDALFLTNAPTATWLTGEIKGKAGEWQSVTLVQEDVAATSEMKLVRLSLTGNQEAEVRVRLA